MAFMQEEVARLLNAVPGSFEWMDAKTSEHTGCSNAVPVYGCLQGSLGKRLLDGPGAHGWMVNTGAMQKG